MEFFDERTKAVTTPVFGRMGRMYVLTNESRLEAWDQEGRVWQTPALREDARLVDPIAPPTIGVGNQPRLDHRTPWRCRHAGSDGAGGHHLQVNDHRKHYDDIYFVDAGRLYAFDDAGQSRWSVDVTSGLAGEPVVLRRGRRQLVVIGDSTGRLRAFTRGGRLAWQLLLNGGITGAPAVAGNTLYVATPARLYAIR
jgi:hypothetical protein